MTQTRLDVVRESRLYTWIEMVTRDPVKPILPAGAELCCRRCGARVGVPMPAPLHEVLALSRDFVDAHRDCRPTTIRVVESDAIEPGEVLLI